MPKRELSGIEWEGLTTMVARYLNLTKNVVDEVLVTLVGQESMTPREQAILEFGVAMGLRDGISQAINIEPECTARAAEIVAVQHFQDLTRTGSDDRTEQQFTQEYIDIMAKMMASLAKRKG